MNKKGKFIIIIAILLLITNITTVGYIFYLQNEESSSDAKECDTKKESKKDTNKDEQKEDQPKENQFSVLQKYIDDESYDKVTKANYWYEDITPKISRANLLTNFQDLDNSLYSHEIKSSCTIFEAFLSDDPSCLEYDINIDNKITVHSGMGGLLLYSVSVDDNNYIVALHKVPYCGEKSLEIYDADTAKLIYEKKYVFDNVYDSSTDKSIQIDQRFGDTDGKKYLVFVAADEEKGPDSDGQYYLTFYKYDFSRQGEKIIEELDYKNDPDCAS